MRMTIIMTILGVTALFEILYGVTTFANSTNLPQQVQGQIAFFFGVLTLAVVNAATDAHVGLNRLRKDIQNIRDGEATKDSADTVAPKP
jgi:hypothetical protein